ARIHHYSRSAFYLLRRLAAIERQAGALHLGATGRLGSERGRKQVAFCGKHFQRALPRSLAQFAELGCRHCGHLPRPARRRGRRGVRRYWPLGGWNSESSELPKKVLFRSARRLRSCAPQSSSSPSLMEHLSLLKSCAVFLCDPPCP